MDRDRGNAKRGRASLRFRTRNAKNAWTFPLFPLACFIRNAAAIVVSTRLRTHV